MNLNLNLWGFRGSFGKSVGENFFRIDHMRILRSVGEVLNKCSLRYGHFSAKMPYLQLFFPYKTSNFPAWKFDSTKIRISPADLRLGFWFKAFWNLHNTLNAAIPTKPWNYFFSGDPPQDNCASFFTQTKWTQCFALRCNR